MTEVERIVDQLKRAFAGEAWHGPALGEIQHMLYHAGQIAILKKASAEDERE
jgi:hypothetical protein